jgi:hypothetical protein
MIVKTSIQIFRLVSDSFAFCVGRQNSHGLFTKSFQFLIVGLLFIVQILYFIFDIIFF